VSAGSTAARVIASGGTPIRAALRVVGYEPRGERRMLPLGPILGFAAVAACLAAAFPLATYTTSLALLGGPHVLAELRYVERRFATRLIGPTSVVIGALIGALVAVRLGRLLGDGSTVAELGLLAALPLVTVPLLRGKGVPVFVAFAVAAALGVGAAFAPAATVLVLAVVHKGAPLGLVWVAPRVAERRRLWVLAAVLLVAVPALIATGLPGAVLGVHPDATLLPGVGALAQHLAAYLPAAWHSAPSAPAVFAAMVYAQCLHYGMVIALLPRSLPDDAPAGPYLGALPPAVFGALMVAAALLVVPYAFDFQLTRAWYAVLAGLHVAVEPPALLLALRSPAVSRDP
jgi:hypothetical protein